MGDRILIFGTYPLLLETYAVIFRRAGYRLLTATTLVQARSLLQQETVDLCLICSGVEAAEAEEMLRTLHGSQPAALHLLLRAGASAQQRPWAQLEEINSLRGPGYLVQQVRVSLAPQHQHATL